MAEKDKQQPAGEARVQPEAVAPQPENTELTHSMGGMTTRADATDLGVPMLPGDPAEPGGPEDALGVGPTRGDYRGRIGPADYHPHETRLSGGKILVEAQRPRAEEIGDVATKKGGVETGPAAERRYEGGAPGVTVLDAPVPIVHDPLLARLVEQQRKGGE
jgi:hypothetical protein